MYKLLTYTVTIFILFLAYSCREKNEYCDYTVELAQAERLLDSQPDSTLAIIKNINFEKISTLRQTAQALYLKGTAKRLLLNYPDAIRSLLFAEKYYDDINDRQMLANVRRQIMTLYDSIGNNQAYAWYALQTAKAYKYPADSDSIFEMYVKAADSYYTYNDRQNERKVYNLMKDIFHDSHDELKLFKIHCIELESRGSAELLGPTGIYKRLNDSLYSGGNWEELIRCDTLLYMPNAIRAFAADLFKEGNDKLGHDLLESYCKYYTCNVFGNDRDAGIIHMTKEFNTPFPYTGTILTRKSFFSREISNIEHITSDFHYNEIVLKEQTIRHQREMMTVIIICCCLVVCVLLLSLRIIMARRRRREEILIQSAAELKATVNQTNHKWLSTLTHLCDTYYDAYARQSTKSKIAKSALAKINEVIDSAEFFTMLETRLNQEKDGIMDKLRQEMPTLREDEYKLLMLNALGFSIPTLSLLMRENRDLIYTRRVRLRTKIQESAPPHAELFLQALA